MKNHLAVVGCGFVGSVFTTELLKRMYAGKLPQDLLFIDCDEVEERNAANQNFSLNDAGKPKALVMQEVAQANHRYAEMRHLRVDGDNVNELLDGAQLLVDGVDNLATRQLLWSWGLRTGVPVLHLGITQDGAGKVEWSHPDHDFFSLAPHRTVGKTIVEPESGVTPPCELARMRGVGLNVGFAGALAVGIYFGFDPESNLEGADTNGYLTEWSATPTSHFPLKETWERIG